MPERFRDLPILFLVGLIPTALSGQTTGQATDVVATTVEEHAAETSLHIELANGEQVAVTLAGGSLYVNGRQAGRYEPGSQLESEWREILEAARATPSDFTRAATAFATAEYSGADAAAATALRNALAPIVGLDPIPVTEDPSAADAALAAEDLPSPVQTAATAQELVRGGLVVELARIEGARQTIERLVPGLPEELSRALEAPLRVVIDADEYTLPEGAELDKSLMLVGTEGTLAGSVTGDVIIADGVLRIDPTGRIEGNVISLDGRVHNNGGTILGRIRDVEQVEEVPVPVRVADRRAPSVFRQVASGIGSLIETVAAYLILAFLGVLTVYFFRRHLETVSDTIAFSFGRSFLAGLAAEILFFPVLLILFVLVLTWLAIPFYVIGFGLAGLFGYLAVAHSIGENLTRHRFPSWAARLRRSNSYYYVLNGLAVLLALLAAAAVAEMGGNLLGWAHGLLIASAVLLTWIAGTSGLGAVILSRAGTRRSFARPHELPDVSVDPLAQEMMTIEEQPTKSRQRQTHWDEDPTDED